MRWGVSERRQNLMTRRIVKQEETASTSSKERNLARCVIDEREKDV